MLPYRRMDTPLLAYDHKYTTKHTSSPPPPPLHPRACLAVKWFCSGHAQFVSFHPGLMSRSTQGLSAPFEAPSRTDGCNMRLLVVLFHVLRNRVIT